MKLIDLNPHWVGAGGPGVSRLNPDTGEHEPVPRRHGVGISFDCPCGCGVRCYVQFENPIDGGKSHAGGHPAWKRKGETFDDLTLSPSIRRAEPGGCGWHGFIENGTVRTV